MSLATFDAATGAAFTEFATSLTFAHTTAGSNRYLQVGIGWQFNSATYRSMTGGGVTYNSVTVNPLIDSGPSSGNRARTIVYDLVAPAAGTHNVVVTLGSGTGDGRTCVIAISFADVDQTTPVLHSASSITSPCSVVSTVGQLVSAFEFVASGTPVSGGDETVRATQIAADGAGVGTLVATTIPSAAGTTTCSVTVADERTLAAFELQGVSGGSTVGRLVGGTLCGGVLVGGLLRA